MKKIMIFITLVFQLKFAYSYEPTYFQGKVRISGRPCTLEILRTYFDFYERPEDFRADVRITVSDEIHGHMEEFFFKLAPTNRVNVFTAMGEGQTNQMNLFIAPGRSGFSHFTHYAVRWWHVNHFHSAQCVDLVPQR